MSSNIIEVKNVQKTFKVREKSSNFREIFFPKYKKIVAVDDISFNVKKGEMLGYLGPNGSGKSTTIKMLTGILEPTSGEILIDGHNPAKERMIVSQKIGVLFGQRTQLWWALPFKDSLQAIKSIYGLSDDVFNNNLKLYRETINIDDLLYKTIRQMSLGQRMLCEIISTFIHDPVLVFLDEPTIGLDIVIKDKIRELIRLINQERNTTVILTSHDMKDVEEICDRLIIIEGGKKIYSGDIDDIYKVYKQKQKILIRTDNITDDVIKIINKDINSFGRCLLIDSKNMEIDIFKYADNDFCLNNVLCLLSKYINIQNIKVLSFDLENVVRDIYNGEFHE